MILRTRILATPHYLLAPNRPITKKQREQLDWPLPMKKAPVIKGVLRRRLREAAKLSTLNDRPDEPLTGPVVLSFVVAYEKGRQILDFDNCISTLKGAIDGLVDAGFMLDDDQVTGIFLTQIKDPEGRGYVDVTVEPAQGARIA